MLLQKTTARANVKSKGTLSQQDHLLKLPLPSLSDTINKWLPTTLPHLNKEEFKTTQQHAQDFIQQAEPMQKYLQDKSISQDNWVRFIYLSSKRNILNKTKPLLFSLLTGGSIWHIWSIEIL